MSGLAEIDVALTGAGRGGEVRDGRSGGGSSAFSFAIMVVFFLVMMLCLVAGVVIYRGVAASQAADNEVRMGSGLLTNLVRMGDMADAVQVGAGPEGEALVLVNTLPSGTYETRIYLYEGSVVQEYAIAGRPYNPEDAVALLESGTFGFAFEDGLLTVRTDAGEFCVAIRSAQDGRGAGTGGGTTGGTASGAGSGGGGA